MQYSPKVTILRRLHAIWLTDNDDMRIIEPQMNSVLEENGLRFYDALQIEQMYHIPNISNVSDAMYLHMNTSLSDDYYYFALIVESFIDFSTLVKRESNTSLERLLIPLTFSHPGTYPVKQSA